ncbi:MBL fold metallo-hydrolase [Nocardia sp. NPDC050712]|uniref:MBL fold metallo-hydrolase n=1 Tax=Nocardia sp. NPDC050712 TaxID=3155518 RepID=UPI0033E2CCC3
MVTTVTRVTHSCVLLDFDGRHVLTDPWFSEKPGYRRGEPLACTPTELPALTAVIASHDHYDHFDVDTFAAYPDKAVPFIVKRGMGAKARKAGFTNVSEVEPWEDTVVDGIRITAAPAQHGVPEITYVLQSAGTTVFFGADTLRIPELDELRTRFGHLDLALVPINGLSIKPAFNRRVVMNAEEAARLCGVLRPGIAVPIHYAFTAGRLRDTLFLGYDGTPERFRSAAAEHAPGTTVHVLAPGEPLTLPTRSGLASS